VASLTSRKSTSKSLSSSSAFSHPLRVKAQKSDAPLVIKASFVFFGGLSAPFLEQPTSKAAKQMSDTISKLKNSFFILTLLEK
jgi:hypothetical protein